MPTFPMEVTLSVMTYRGLRALRIWAVDHGRPDMITMIDQLLVDDPRDDLSLDAPIDSLDLTDQLENIARQRGATTVGELIYLTENDFCTRPRGGYALSRNGSAFRDLVARLYVQTGYTLRGSRLPL